MFIRKERTAVSRSFLFEKKKSQIGIKLVVRKAPAWAKKNLKVGMKVSFMQGSTCRKLHDLFGTERDRVNRVVKHTVKEPLGMKAL